MDDDLPEDEEQPDDELEDAGEEELTGGDNQIDDPIRIYLMQMGEIPMLTRQQETTSAKHIQASRGRYRYHLLATDYMLQSAIGMLEGIRDGKTRLDRTMEVSVINLREKRRLLKVLDPEPAHAPQPHATQPAGLRHRRQQASAAETTSPGLAAAGLPARPGSATG